MLAPAQRKQKRTWSELGLHPAAILGQVAFELGLHLVEHVGVQLVFVVVVFFVEQESCAQIQFDKSVHIDL